MRNIDKELIAEGYHTYSISTADKWSRQFFQKKVSLSGKVLYFINITAWELPNDPMVHRYSVEVDLYKPLGKDPAAQIVVQLNIDDTVSVVDVEVEIASMYKKLGCIPNPHNN